MGLGAAWRFPVAFLVMAIATAAMLPTASAQSSLLGTVVTVEYWIGQRLADAGETIVANDPNDGSDRIRVGLGFTRTWFDLSASGVVIEQPGR